MNTTPKEILDRYPIFNSLSADQRERLASQMIEHRVDRYAYIYHEGEIAGSLYLLYEGNVKIGQHSADQREAIKEVLHSPNLFGASILHGERVRSDFAQALNNPVRLYEIRLEDFNFCMGVNHAFSLDVISTLSRRLMQLEQRLATLMTHDARGRIIEFIKKSADERGKRVGYETLIKHSLTQQEIANMTGTSRQTVTHVLNDLKKSNLIYFNRKSILVRDIAKLA